MTNFLDMINDPEVQDELKEWLEPSIEIINQIKEFTEDTILEDSVVICEQDNLTLVLKYYLTCLLSEKHRADILKKREMLNKLNIPFEVQVEVYEPQQNPCLFLRSEKE